LPVKIHGCSEGVLDVCYVEPPPNGTSSPFLDEELKLIQSICEQIKIVIEKKQAQEALLNSHIELEQLVNERTEELTKTAMDLRKERDFILFSKNTPSESLIQEGMNWNV